MIEFLNILVSFRYVAGLIDAVLILVTNMEIEDECDMSDYEDDIIDDSPALILHKNLSLKVNYKVLGPEDVAKEMEVCISEVNTVIQLPATTTRMLLNHFNWNQENLLER